ncbi:MAG: prolipoprotein diacylglyceryl transferase [Candidatus Atribacteria bacterium]|nr:prolipoprotein diacylglyceryl transferase [Candidatus Atribacteria bacterium]
MHRIMFHIGQFPVYSYGVMLGVAFLVGIIYAVRRAPKYGVTPDAVVEVSVLCIFGAIIGSRLVFVLLNWSLYKDHLIEILMVREGGLTFYGGMLGAILLAVPYMVKKKYSLPALFDVCTPPIALGYAIARIGCYLNGCCYGRVSSFTTFPLGVQFPFLTGYRFPTQLYSLVYSLVILFILLRLEKHQVFRGELFLNYLWLYGIARFLIEYLREEPFSIFGILTSAQFACLIIIMVTLMLREILKRQHVRTRH